MPPRSKTEIDADVPPLSAERIMRMRPAKDVLPKELLDAHRQRRAEALASGDHPPVPLANKGGRPKLDAPKHAISIRLDADVLESLKRAGPGWQTRINDLLRKALRLKAAR